MSRKKWSRQKIIDEILELVKQGEDLSDSNIQKKHGPLYSASCQKRYFGGWGKSIEAAGLHYDKIKESKKQRKIEKQTVWTKEKIKHKILELHDAGFDLSYTSMREQWGSMLTAAASKRCFGSWKNAIEATGLEYSKINKYSGRPSYNEQMVIDEILELYKYGANLSSSYMQKNHGSLYHGSVKCFGSWRNAIEASGLDYEKIIKIEHWSKQRIIDEILELYNAGEDLNALHIKKIKPRLFHAAYENKYFGNWENAITAAGLDYLQISKVGKRKSIEKRVIWSRQKIIARILELHRNGEALNYNNVRKNHSQLAYAAIEDKYFGSWRGVIEAAGLNYDDIIKVKSWSKQEIIDEILKLKESGEDLNHLSMMKTQTALIAAACSKRYFGSWKNAIEAAGLDYDEINKYADRISWDDETIISKIKELYGEGRNLQHSAMEKEEKALHSAAVRAFGNWKSAIFAAGIDYDEYRTRKEPGYWSKKKITEKILEIYGEGEPLNDRYIRTNYPFLIVAAAKPKYFGGWKNAVEAAGFDYDKIRLDHLTESYKGSLFEKYVLEIFRVLEKNFEYHKRFDYGGITYIPDFVDNEKGIWIDAKLRSYTNGIEKTVYKYLEVVDKLVIYYLIGRPRKWYQDKVIFKCIKDFYPELREKGREDIIKNLSLLDRGVIPSKYQKELDEYLKKEKDVKAE